MPVNRKDVNIRARRDFMLSKEPEVPPSPAQRLAAVLQQPLLATELPIKVATYNLRTPGASTVKVVVTTEFGRNATAAEEATVAYVVLTDKGKVVGSSVSVNKAAPVRLSAPGPLHATTLIEVPPGDTCCDSACSTPADAPAASSTRSRPACRRSETSRSPTCCWRRPMPARRRGRASARGHDD